MLVLYSTYLTPAATAASIAAIEIIQKEYLIQQPQLHAQTLQLKKCLTSYFPDIPQYDSPILPLVIGDPGVMLNLASKLAQQYHIHVGAIRPPSVPKGTSRLRLSLHCNLEFDVLAERLENFFQNSL